MIKKLQRKFIIITMVSLFFVMLLLIGAINGINYYRTEQKIYGALLLLSKNKGEFPDIKGDNKKHPLPGEPKFGFQMNEETPYETRYFTVDTDKDKNIQEINTSHINISAEEADTYARKAIKSGRTSGYVGIYKFMTVQEGDNFLLIFMNCRREIQANQALLLTSCAVGLGTLLMVFILVSVLSKKAIKPIIESMEKQKQFITDAGHEIKTPLAIISANADVLEMIGGDNEWITSIRNQTTRLDKLVKNLLMLSKMEEGGLKKVFTDFDMSRVTSETAANFVAVAKMQNKEFLMKIQPGIMFHGDEGSIQQLVSTLSDNAIKYSNEGGVIKVSLSSSKKGIKLDVFNTADELDTKNLNKLFDRFYRADSSRSRETGGYGIGLSIARTIAEAHHGKIIAKSEDGKSIHFIVTLG